MHELNPTLWRTCRVLAGKTRMVLMRQLHDKPGQSVSMLAQAAKVGLSDASQELRRIQSRGLLQVDRKGLFVYYRLGADPQVPSAAPLVKALKDFLSRSATDQDGEFIRIATGFAHARRLAIVRELIQTPQTPPLLQSTLRIPQSALSHHTDILRRMGLVQREGPWLIFTPPAHPLAQALARLIRQ